MESNVKQKQNSSLCFRTRGCYLSNELNALAHWFLYNLDLYQDLFSTFFNLQLTKISYV